MTPRGFAPDPEARFARCPQTPDGLDFADAGAKSSPSSRLFRYFTTVIRSAFGGASGVDFEECAVR